MLKRILVLLILIPLLLTACSGGGQQTPVEATPAPEEAAPAPTNTAVILPTEVPQVEAEEATDEAAEAVADAESEVTYPEIGVASECTMVSALPDPPAQFAEISIITEDDWVHGPDTAALTIIEYADFQ